MDGVFGLKEVIKVSESERNRTAGWMEARTEESWRNTSSEERDRGGKEGRKKGVRRK